ncbi:cytochrome d ubiquinol oxidase subunit II [Kitasatospora sp. MAP5-34]|uniref:cytochrome d ubiquinol oxidase subunit II n=1 Tax=Kitasatospora sp. MAP5-34 TaxID=3035102 RepID=UPI002475973A|nr:cytochrome d ubiquinol oxidase subunit II [Kitasatospora sp. MAP5-34]MDH6578212.1 cytochrome d ubiquinol oxidase subunit II [Kitasatospora sp. MAP5-34]
MAEYASYALILFALGAYVVLDGYDLGIGILGLFDRNDERRKEYTELVATAWDANESWIILAGVTLWAALPGIYATVLPGVYLPLVVMLLAFVLRGLGLEMQSSAPGYRRGWGRLFGVSSLVVTLCQGLVVGTVLSGLPQHGGVFDGGALRWLTPYSGLCALGVTALYLLAGAAWLQAKTEGSARRRAGRLGRPLLALTVAACLVLGFGLEVADPQHFRFDQPLRAVLFGLLVAASAGCGALAWYGFGREPDARPFIAVLCAQVAGLLALVTATAPVVVPPGLTVHAAASPVGSQVFLLIGIGCCMPVVLAYNIYAWWVFRGKYRPPTPTALAVPAKRVEVHIDLTVSHIVVKETGLWTVARRVGFTLLGLGMLAVAQDVFGGQGEWIAPVALVLFSAGSLTAWLVGDRRAAAAGQFEIDRAARR